MTSPENLKIIDLSMDYRLKAEGNDFIYGLPELNRRATCKAKHVANPGCFATCIQLGIAALGQAPDAERRHPGECHHRQHRGRRKAGSYQPLQLGATTT